MTQLFKKGKPVILLMHVPMTAPTMTDDLKAAWGGRNIAIGTTDGAINRNEYTKQFENLVYGADSPVAAIIAGHVHMDHTDIVGGKITQYVANAGYDNGDCRVYVVSGS